MKKVICIIVAILLISCTNKINTLQQINGFSDCTNSEHVSWNDGNAHFSDGSFVGHFSFIVQNKGELIFQYLLHNYGDADELYYGLLLVTIDGKTAFYDRAEMMKFQKVSLGQIEKGREITFTGCSCDVKEIMIVGDVEEDDIHPQWDF